MLPLFLSSYGRMEAAEKSVQFTQSTLFHSILRMGYRNGWKIWSISEKVKPGRNSKRQRRRRSKLISTMSRPPWMREFEIEQTPQKHSVLLPLFHSPYGKMDTAERFGPIQKSEARPIFMWKLEMAERFHPIQIKWSTGGRVRQQGGGVATSSYRILASLNTRIRGQAHTTKCTAIHLKWKMVTAERFVFEVTTVRTYNFILTREYDNSRWSRHNKILRDAPLVTFYSSHGRWETALTFVPIQWTNSAPQCSLSSSRPSYDKW